MLRDPHSTESSLSAPSEETTDTHRLRRSLSSSSLSFSRLETIRTRSSSSPSARGEGQGQGDGTGSEEKRRSRRFRFAQVQVIVLGYCAYVGLLFCRSDFSVVAPLLKEDASVSFDNRIAGLLLAVGNAVHVTGKLTLSSLADVFGSKTALMIGLGGPLVGTIGFAFSQSFPLFVLCWSIVRYFSASGWPALSQIVSQWVEPKYYSRVLGIFSTSSQIGAVLTSATLGALISSFSVSWSTVLLCAAGVCGCCLLLVVLYLKSSPGKAGFQASDLPRSILHSSSADEDRISDEDIELQPLSSDSNSVVDFTPLKRLVDYPAHIEIVSSTDIKKEENVDMNIPDRHRLVHESRSHWSDDEAKFAEEHGRLSLCSVHSSPMPSFGDQTSEVRALSILASASTRIDDRDTCSGPPVSVSSSSTSSSGSSAATSSSHSSSSLASALSTSVEPLCSNPANLSDSNHSVSVPVSSDYPSNENATIPTSATMVMAASVSKNIRRRSRIHCEAVCVKNTFRSLRRFVCEPRFWLIAVFNAILTSSMEIQQFLNLFIGDTFSIEPGRAAWISSVFPFGCVFSILISGYLSDKCSRKTSSYIFSAMVFSSGVILLVLIVLLNLFPDQLWTVLVSFFLYGFLIGAPYYLPVGLFAVEFGGKIDSALLTGILEAIGYSAAIAFDAVTGIFSEAYGWNAVFILLAVLAAVATIVLLWFAALEGRIQASHADEGLVPLTFSDEENERQQSMS